MVALTAASPRLPQRRLDVHTPSAERLHKGLLSLVALREPRLGVSVQGGTPGSQEADCGGLDGQECPGLFSQGELGVERGWAVR